MTFELGEKCTCTSYYETPSQCAKRLKELGAEFVGSNCRYFGTNTEYIQAAKRVVESNDKYAQISK